MATKETKPPIKKLTLEIVDEAALAEAYPEVMREVTFKKPDRAVLYPIVKAMHEIGRTVPGVKAYYAADEEPAGGAPETAQGAAEGSPAVGEAVGKASPRSTVKGAA